MKIKTKSKERGRVLANQESLNTQLINIRQTNGIGKSEPVGRGLWESKLRSIYISRKTESDSTIPASGKEERTWRSHNTEGAGGIRGLIGGGGQDSILTPCPLRNQAMRTSGRAKTGRPGQCRLAQSLAVEFLEIKKGLAFLSFFLFKIN